MKKFIPMAVVAVCVVTAAFASIRQPAAAVANTRYTLVDTVIPQDTTETPLPDTTVLPVDTTTLPVDTTDTDTSVFK